VSFILVNMRGVKKVGMHARLLDPTLAAQTCQMPTLFTAAARTVPETAKTGVPEAD
jgi:hypothetical protein